LVTRSFVREGQLFARSGGEEFVLLLPDTPHELALRYAEELRASIAERTFEWEGSSLAMTSSFVVASSTTSSDTPEALLARADERLYPSKREGRNRVSG